MNQQTFDDTKRDVLGRLSDEQLMAPESLDVFKSQIDEAMGARVESGEILILTDEEERLLRAFRKFGLRAEAGTEFRWKLGDVQGVTLTEESGLIRDPQDVSEA